MIQFKTKQILTSFDLTRNLIADLGFEPINIRTEILNLESNFITFIDEFTFNGSEIGTLLLGDNRRLTYIHPRAFVNLRGLHQLDLSGTSIVRFPTLGLENLRSLSIRNNFVMKKIPSMYNFPNLEKAHLTYSYHCCAFLHPELHDPLVHEKYKQMQKEFDLACEKKRQNLLVAGVNLSRKWTELQGTTTESPNELLSNSGSALIDLGGMFKNAPSGGFSVNVLGNDSAFLLQIPDLKIAENHNVKYLSPHITPLIECGQLTSDLELRESFVCYPQPDVLNPCEDIMGKGGLRIVAWLVVFTSSLGNLAVIIMIVVAHKKFKTIKFLQLNLAIGDLFMAVYMIMLSLADTFSRGNYFNYALEWQHGTGCKVAGAASLFSSQLSIFSLVLITIERYFTIMFTCDRNKRLRMKWAARLMCFGWIYAFGAATFPIFANINSYSKTSICLPLRTDTPLDRTYLFVLLVVDTMAAIVILVCYAKMYLLITRERTAVSLKEQKIALRMAVLLITDFVCWGPIIFYGSTALLGYPMIDLSSSKLLVVIFYPLNSMANPFLYFILQRQFRQDIPQVRKKLLALRDSVYNGWKLRRTRSVSSRSSRTTVNADRNATSRLELVCAVTTPDGQSDEVAKKTSRRSARPNPGHLAPVRSLSVKTASTRLTQTSLTSPVAILTREDLAYRPSDSQTGYRSCGSDRNPMSDGELETLSCPALSFRCNQCRDERSGSISCKCYRCSLPIRHSSSATSIWNGGKPETSLVSFPEKPQTAKKLLSTSLAKTFTKQKQSSQMGSSSSDEDNREVNSGSISKPTSGHESQRIFLKRKKNPPFQFRDFRSRSLIIQNLNIIQQPEATNGSTQTFDNQVETEL